MAAHLFNLPTLSPLIRHKTTESSVQGELTRDHRELSLVFWAHFWHSTQFDHAYSEYVVKKGGAFLNLFKFDRKVIRIGRNSVCESWRAQTLSKISIENVCAL